MSEAIIELSRSDKSLSLIHLPVHVIVNGRDVGLISPKEQVKRFVVLDNSDSLCLQSGSAWQLGAKSPSLKLFLRPEVINRFKWGTNAPKGYAELNSLNYSNWLPIWCKMLITFALLISSFNSPVYYLEYEKSDPY